MLEEQNLTKSFVPYLDFITFDSEVILTTVNNKRNDLLFSSDHIPVVCQRSNFSYKVLGNLFAEAGA